MISTAKQPAVEPQKSARPLDSDVHTIIHGFWFIQLWRKVKKTIDKKQKVYRTAHWVNNSQKHNLLSFCVTVPNNQLLYPRYIFTKGTWQLCSHGTWPQNGILESWHIRNLCSNSVTYLWFKPILARRRFPKTDLDKATKAHPAGPKTIHQCYDWPSKFLDRLFSRYGRPRVLEKLARWHWAVSTAFSGIGAAESVWAPRLHLACYWLPRFQFQTVFQTHCAVLTF